MRHPPKSYDNDPHKHHALCCWLQPKILSTPILLGPYIWRVGNISVSLIISSVIPLNGPLLQNLSSYIMCQCWLQRSSVCVWQGSSIDCYQSEAGNKLLITHASPIHEYISHSHWLVTWCISNWCITTVEGHPGQIPVKNIYMYKTWQICLWHSTYSDSTFTWWQMAKN